MEENIQCDTDGGLKLTCCFSYAADVDKMLAQHQAVKNYKKSLLLCWWGHVVSGIGAMRKYDPVRGIEGSSILPTVW